MSICGCMLCWIFLFSIFIALFKYINWNIFHSMKTVSNVWMNHPVNIQFYNGKRGCCIYIYIYNQRQIVCSCMCVDMQILQFNLCSPGIKAYSNEQCLYNDKSCMLLSKSSEYDCTKTYFCTFMNSINNS